MLGVQESEREHAWTPCDSVSSVTEADEEFGTRQLTTGNRGHGETAIEVFNKETGDEDANVVSLQNLLTKQFSDMQKVLTENCDSALSLAGRHADALRRAEIEVDALITENEKLRARLAAAGLTANGSETAGTGESTWGSMNKAAQRGLTAAGSAAKRRASRIKGFFTTHEAPCPVPPPTDAEVAEPTSRAPGMHLPGSAWTSGTEESASSSTATPKVRTLALPVSSECDDTSAVDSVSSLKDPSKEENSPPRVGIRKSACARRKERDKKCLVMDTEPASVVPVPSERSAQETAVDRRKSARSSRLSRIKSTGVAFEEESIRKSDPDLLGLKLGAANKAVFADAAAMKEKVRQAIGKEEYNVCNMYHDKGVAQAIAKSAIFDTLTLSVIALNALWISIETDYNKEDFLLDYHPVFLVAENFFCVYFTVEWCIRFLSFKRKRDGLRDAWFVFDSTLVTMMVLETWVMTAIMVMTGKGKGGGMGNASILRLLRLLRLTRMARMARLLRAMPELMIMVKGIAVAARSVFFTLLLLVLIQYVFAIAFTQLTSETSAGDQYFNTVPDAMVTLLLYGTLLEDVPDVVLTVGDEHLLYGALFLLFILLASLTVMNMLVGVLVEVVSVVSAVEKEQLVVNFVRGQIQQMLQMSGIDANNDNLISKDEFESLLENPKAANALQEVGVDVVGLVDFTDFIFKDGVELSFPDFMETVLQLRGSNTATVKDVVDLRKFIISELQGIEEAMLSGKTRDQIEMENFFTSQSLGQPTAVPPRLQSILSSYTQNAGSKHSIISARRATGAPDTLESFAEMTKNM